MIVVGAGVAGLLSALELRRTGLDCLVLEAGSRDSWASPHCLEIDTASIQNGVVPMPCPDCTVHDGTHGGILMSPGGIRFEFSTLPIRLIRYDLYLRQLLAESEAAGAAVRFDTEVTRISRTEGDSRRLSVDMVQSGNRLAADCDLLVLATGNSTRLDRQLYAHTGISRKIPSDSWVCALHELWKIRGVNGRSVAFPAEPGRGAYVVGRHGPYSVECTWVSPSRDLASCLAGTLPGDGHPPPSEVLAMLRSKVESGAEVLSSAGSSIPIRRPLDVLAGHGVVLIGNAACQVFPATGCGVALAGHAAHMLAEHAGAYCRDTGKPEILWRYASSYHRRWGGIQAASEVFTRGVRRLGRQGWDVAELLMKVKVTNGTDFLRSLELRTPVPPAVEWVRRSGAIVRLGTRFGPLSAIMARALAVQGLYRFSYPERPDAGAMKQFLARASTLVG